MSNTDTFPGKVYVVSSAEGCTITNASGVVLCRQEAGSQAVFIAPSGGLVFSNPDAVITPVQNGSSFRLSLGGVSNSFGSNGGGGEGSLPTFVASRALISDQAGNIAASVITSTELGYLDGASGNIQTQLNGKQDAISGAADSVVVTDASGKPTVSGSLSVSDLDKLNGLTATTTELNYLHGATSNIQAQLNAKAATATLTAHATDTGIHVTAEDKERWNSITAGGEVTLPSFTASRALQSDADGNMAASEVTSDELNSLAGVTSNVQEQINAKATSSALSSHTSNTTAHITASERAAWNAKQAAVSGAASTITSANLTGSRALISDSNGKVAASAVTSKELSHLGGATSNIQTQLNGKFNTTGGYLVGDIVFTDNAAVRNVTSALSLLGGTDTRNGAVLHLYGSTNGERPGNFLLRANDVLGSSKELIGSADGALTWGGVHVVIVGEIKYFAGTTTPSGYLLCDGSEVSRTTYAALFSVIGTRYGVGNGSSSFNLPNLIDSTAQLPRPIIKY